MTGTETNMRKVAIVITLVCAAILDAGMAAFILLVTWGAQ
jgi:hypothetical protein